MAGRSSTAARFVLTGAALLLALLLPFVLRNYYLHLLSALGIWIILAAGQFILTGLVGQVSLGQAAFYGIGAYGAVLLAVDLHWPVWIAALASIPLAALVGAAIGLPALRSRGPYLSLVTIAFGFVVHAVLLNWVKVTRGYQGIVNVPPLQLFGISFHTSFAYYYVVLAATIVTVLLTARWSESPWGRAWLAIKNSESAAVAAGINVSNYKLLAFAISAGLAGAAGSLYAFLDRFISPELFTFDTSIRIVTAVIIGGLGHIRYAVLGTILLIFTHEALSSLPQLEVFLYGIVLVAVLVFLPQGFGGWLLTSLAKVRQR